MNDEESLDLAALAALDMLEGEDARTFEAECLARPELAALVESLRAASHAMARHLPRVAPPPEVRERILRTLTGAPEAGPSGTDRQPVLSPRRPGQFPYWKIAAAAVAILVPLGAAIWFGMDASRQRKAVADAHRDNSSIRETLEETRQSRDQQVVEAENLRQQVRTITEQAETTVSRVRQLEGENGTLARELDSLKSRKLQDQARIALLTSQVNNQPKALAVSVWDKESQNGYLIVENLPILPANRDYQLWVIDSNGTPVSAGVFKVDAQGRSRVEFKPVSSVVSAGKFAVTREPAGGRNVPTMNQMVLLGE